MKAKPAQELGCFQFKQFLFVAVAVILVTESYLFPVNGNQPVVSNGYAVAVPPQVLDNLVRACKRFFGINHPFRTVHLLEKLRSNLKPCLKGNQLKPVAELPPENFAQCFNRKKKTAVVTGIFPVSVYHYPTCRDDAVQVWVQHQVLPPRLPKSSTAGRHVWSTAIKPVSAPRWRGSPEKADKVSLTALNSSV